MTTTYKPPAQFNIETAPPTDHAARKRDPKYIKLQQIEHQISEFNLLRVFITIILFIIIVKLFQAAIINDEDYYAPLTRPTEVIIRLLQLIGYAYGLQAHISKDYKHGRIFLVYVLSSFALIGFQLVKAIQGDSEGPNVTNVILVSGNFIFNIFLFLYTYRFVKTLKQRDDLRNALDVKIEP